MVVENNLCKPSLYFKGREKYLQKCANNDLKVHNLKRFYLIKNYEKYQWFIFMNV